MASPGNICFQGRNLCPRRLHLRRGGSRAPAVLLCGPQLQLQRGGALVQGGAQRGCLVAPPRRIRLRRLLCVWATQLLGSSPGLAQSCRLFITSTVMETRRHAAASGAETPSRMAN